MGKTKIDWCDEVSNWFTGCSGSCPWCYARRMAKRLAHVTGTVYERVSFLTSSSPYSDGDPFFPAVHLDVRSREYNRLLRIKRPVRVFLGSMGDINACRLWEKAATFGEDGSLLPSEQWWTAEKLQNEVAIWCTALETHGKKFLILTKAPGYYLPEVRWPGNVFLGVSVTCNDDAWRVERLLARDRSTCFWNSGIKLWASVEPLVDPDFDPDCLAGLDWVVVGLRTGAGAARPFLDEWTALMTASARVVAWCKKHKVPVFVKNSITKYEKYCGIDLPREILE